MADRQQSATSIFISHSGKDNLLAQETARQLSEGGITCLIDDAMLQAGDNFVAFMEHALESSHYCLLLWSRAASTSPWVQAEWHAALARSIASRASFLFTARLEDVPVPRLLAPRQWIDFFPNLASGVRVLLQKLGLDRKVAAAANKPIGTPNSGLPEASGGTAIYLTSELFDIVVPMSVAPTAPVGALLTSAIRALSLPTYQTIDPRGRLAVRMSYELARGNSKLPRELTLAQAGIAEGDLMQLLTFCEIVTPVAPTISDGTKLSFRSGGQDDRGGEPAMSEAAARARAESMLRAALMRNGLLQSKP